jgi:hypothetical protein
MGSPTFASKGWRLDRKVEYLQERIAYMIGFGLPATIVTSFGPPLVNMAIFALIYPFVCPRRGVVHAKLKKTVRYPSAARSTSNPERLSPAFHSLSDSHPNGFAGRIQSVFLAGDVFRTSSPEISCGMGFRWAAGAHFCDG